MKWNPRLILNKTMRIEKSVNTEDWVVLFVDQNCCDSHSLSEALVWFNGIVWIVKRHKMSPAYKMWILNLWQLTISLLSICATHLKRFKVLSRGTNNRLTNNKAIQILKNLNWLIWRSSSSPLKSETVVRNVAVENLHKHLSTVQLRQWCICRISTVRRNYHNIQFHGKSSTLRAAANFLPF